MNPTLQSPCGRLTLYLGDCNEVLPHLAERSIDALVTDPPYGISDGERLTAEGASGEALSTMDLDWDRELPLDWIQVTAPLLKDGAACVVWTDKAELHPSLKPALARFGIRHLQDLFWNKTQASLNPRLNFGNAVEAAFFGRTPGKVLCWNGGNHRANLFRVAKPSPQERVHPTQKPLKLMVWCLEPITAAGHVVLDPFMGSGTTGAAALAMGRKFIGIERDPGHFKAAATRLMAVADQGQLWRAGEVEARG